MNWSDLVGRGEPEWPVWEPTFWSGVPNATQTRSLVRVKATWLCWGRVVCKTCDESHCTCRQLKSAKWVCVCGGGSVSPNKTEIRLLVLVVLLQKQETRRLDCSASVNVTSLTGSQIMCLPAKTSATSTGDSVTSSPHRKSPEEGVFRFQGFRGKVLRVTTAKVSCGEEVWWLEREKCGKFDLCGTTCVARDGHNRKVPLCRRQ